MNKTYVIQLTLMGIGVAGLIASGYALKSGGKLEHEPNILTLKGSPFGRTLALAMRGPVDIYWHRGAVHDHGGGPHSHGKGQHQANGGHESTPSREGGFHDHSLASTRDHSHDGEEGVGGHVHEPQPVSDGHEHGPDCGCDLTWEPEPGAPLEDNLAGKLKELAAKQAAAASQGAKAKTKEDQPPAEFAGVRPYMLDLIDSMRKSYYSRTNTQGEGALHKAYIMAETERRLSLSYQMDPTNIACYGSYFLFLSEAIARLEGGNDEALRITVGQKKALALANFTLQYCLRHQDEAPAMITAATAAHDYLQIHLSAPNPDLQVATAFLEAMDHSIKRFETLREQMVAEGSWGKLGVHRVNEIEGAYGIIRVLREADFRTIGELSATAGGPAQGD